MFSVDSALHFAQRAGVGVTRKCIIFLFDLFVFAVLLEVLCWFVVLVVVVAWCCFCCVYFPNDFIRKHMRK